MHISEKSSNFAAKREETNTIMKQLFTRLLCIAAVMASFTFSGCEADVDLGNIDKSASVKAELALPIGSINAQMGDFLGDSVIQNLSIDEDGCYVYCDTFHTRKSYHDIDLSSYITDSHSSLPIRQHLLAQQPELSILPFIPIPADTTFHVDFVLPFKFEGINSSMQKQRIDSMIVALASFASNITTRGLSSLTWDEITKLELILNPETFRRESMTVDIPVKGYDFGKVIYIDVDNFHINLMKDIHQAPSFENIVDSTSFTLRFHFHTKREHIITDEASIEYSLQLDLIHYDAVFGYFEASHLMRDERKDVPLAEYWDGWNALDGFMLPVREPSVFLAIEHAIAIPLRLELSELTLKDKDGNEKQMTFDGQPSKSILLEPDIQVTDPLTAHSRDTIWLDYTAANGNLAELMTIHPEYISYNFDVSADTTYDMPQYRLVDDTDIRLTMGAEIPFKFNSGTKLFYTDTLKDLNIDRLSLDSLIKNVELIDTINDAKLSLFLTFENYIPFAVNAELDFLDKMGEIVTFEGLNDIKLAYPKVENYVAIEPGKSNMEIAVSYSDLDKLASISALRYSLSLGENTDPVDLTKDAALKIYVGVKANVDMVMDFESLFGE